MPVRILRAITVFILGCVLGWPYLSSAGETRREQFILGDNTERIFIQGIRPMGMGGAFTALANDENALFYNPAGLARIKHWRFTFPGLTFGTDTRSFDNLVYLLGNVDAVGDFMDGSISPELVDNLAHTRLHLQHFTFLPEIRFTYIEPHYGFGAWLFQDTFLETGAILLPEASWNIRLGIIENFSFGWGWDIPKFGYLAAGISVKAIQQAKTAEEDRNVLDLNDIEMGMEWGMGFDIGALYQPTNEFSFALVIADLYTRVLGDVHVPNLKIGFAYQPYYLNFPDLDATLAVDLVELNWQGDNEFKNTPNNAAQINFSKLRIGVEFILSGLVALRTGLHQGYPTAGISLLTSFINIDWAYYGRELGTYPGQNPEWNHRLSIDWHTGSKVAPPTPTVTLTMTPTPTATALPYTPTPTATATSRPTPRPTLTGKVPKLHGKFVGFTGTITLVPKLPDDLGEVASWKLSILDKSKKTRTIKSYKGQGFPPKSFVWNGKTRQGKRVSSKKQYPFNLKLTLAAGGTKIIAGTLVIVDTIPKLYTSKNYEIYPDKVYFSIKQPLKSVKNWKLDVFNDANKLIRSYHTQEALFKAFAWDAKDEDGTVASNNASYRYELTITDKKENQILISDRIRPVKGQVYLTENRTTIKIGGVLFSTGKAYLTAEMFDKVIKNAYLIQDEPNAEVMINGHTDSTGPRKLNMRLSLVRAESVRRFLVDQQSVQDYQLDIKGWGPTRPISTNKTKAGRKKNRRVEVVIRIPQ